MVSWAEKTQRQESLTAKNAKDYRKAREGHRGPSLRALRMFFANFVVKCFPNEPISDGG